MRLGRLTLRGPNLGGISRDGASLSLEGTETHNTLADANAVRRYREELHELEGQVVPLTWAADPELDGFYVVESMSVNTGADRPAAARIDWSAKLHRLGDEHEVEVSSRLLGGALSDANLGTPERWHAPAFGGTAYTHPANGFVDRTNEDANTVRVFRGLPADADPRWLVTPDDYYNGAARIEDANGVPIVGTRTRVPGDELTITNGLVRATFLSNPLRVESFDGTAWRPVDWSIRISGSSQTWGRRSVVVRNSPEAVTVRHVYHSGDDGNRANLDLTLHRGSRTVHAVLSATTAWTLGARRWAADAGADMGGWVEDDVDDANGNRWVVGTHEAYTPDTTNGGLDSTSAVRSYAFYLGMEIGGSTAQAGDDGADLYDQYLGTPSETQVIIPR